METIYTLGGIIFSVVLILSLTYAFMKHRSK
mgnify:CR=1 FL=1